MIFVLTFRGVIVFSDGDGSLGLGLCFFVAIRRLFGFESLKLWAGNLQLGRAYWGEIGPSLVDSRF